MPMFDAHVRLGNCLYGYALDVDRLNQQMDDLEIERAVLCPVRPKTYDFRHANDLVAEAVGRDNERFVGFARVDPWLGTEAVDELERAVSQLGLKGLLLDPWEDHFVISDPIVDPIIRKASADNIPVMISGGYPNFSHPGQIAATASRHKDVTFIATHGGQLNISGLLLADARMMLQQAPNVIIETSGIYREDFIEDCVNEFGADRVVFGSSAPIFNQQFETLRIRHAHLSEAIKEQIGRGNLARLLDGSRVA